MNVEVWRPCAFLLLTACGSSNVAHFDASIAFDGPPHDGSAQIDGNFASDAPSIDGDPFAPDASPAESGTYYPVLSPLSGDCPDWNSDNYVFNLTLFPDFTGMLTYNTPDCVPSFSGSSPVSWSGGTVDFPAGIALRNCQALVTTVFDAFTLSTSGINLTGDASATAMQDGTGIVCHEIYLVTAFR